MNVSFSLLDLLPINVCFDHIYNHSTKELSKARVLCYTYYNQSLQSRCIDQDTFSVHFLLFLYSFPSTFFSHWKKIPFILKQMSLRLRKWMACTKETGEWGRLQLFRVWGSKQIIPTFNMELWDHVISSASCNIGIHISLAASWPASFQIPTSVWIFLGRYSHNFPECLWL